MNKRVCRKGRIKICADNPRCYEGIVYLFLKLDIPFKGLHDALIELIRVRWRHIQIFPLFYALVQIVQTPSGIYVHEATISPYLDEIVFFIYGLVFAPMYYFHNAAVCNKHKGFILTRLRMVTESKRKNIIFNIERWMENFSLKPFNYFCFFLHFHF